MSNEERADYIAVSGLNCTELRAVILNALNSKDAEAAKLRTENATLKAECGLARQRLTSSGNSMYSDQVVLNRYARARTATNQLCPEWAKENP